MSKIDMSKIAVMNICYQFYPFKSFLSSVTQMGIRKIDIWAGYPHLALEEGCEAEVDRKSTRLNSSHLKLSRMPSSA